MCGIAGIVNTKGAGPDLSGQLEAMLRAVRHRGPDDEGVWRSPGDGAAFVHARLSILDLSAAGHQPMSTPDGRFTITYNGEIFNFWELRRSLEQRGIEFHTRTDTEVILRGYEADGPAFVAGLRGMFAFALWDERQHTCLIARDRFGIKPFYYHTGAGRLTFASEVRALLASGIVPRALDPDGLYGYFRTGSVAEPRTLLNGVRCLEAGHYAIWRDGQLSSHKYWDFDFTPRAISEDESVAVTRRVLLDSVAHHFISDTPVGVFLSGGIDSTVLAVLARQAGQQDLHTFSITFPDSPDDEGPVARRTAQHVHARHEEWPMDGATGKRLFTAFLAAADQPSIDGLNTFTVSKFARDHGLKVVLSGLGGDELFGGYPSFERVPAFARWNRRLSHAGPLRLAAGRALEAVAGDPRSRRVGDMLGQPAGLESAYATFRGIFTRAEARTLTERYTGTPMADPAADATPGSNPDPTDRDRVSRLEFTHFMRNQLLRDADAMSMAWGLELRVPFLDNEVVGEVSRIPAAIRLRPHKRLLLQAVPEVPDWVAGRPKGGFLFPIQQWMADEWRDTFAEIDRNAPVPTETWYRKWCLFVLDRWVERLGEPLTLETGPRG